MYKPKSFENRGRTGIDSLRQPTDNQYNPIKEAARLLDLDGSLDKAGRLAFRLLGEVPWLLPRITLRATEPEPIRIGIFGGFDPEPVEAGRRLARVPLQFLADEESLASRIEAHVYPASNFPAFSHGNPRKPQTQPLRGVLLRASLWQSSERPEAYYLERELGVHEFDGLLLVTANPFEPAWVSAAGKVLEKGVVAPVLARLANLEIATGSWHPEYSLLRGAELRPEPFQIRINYPLGSDPERTNLGRLIAELIREYRSFLSFQENI